MSPTRNLFRALMRGLRKANNRRVGLCPPAQPRRKVVGVEDLVASLCAAKPFVAGKIGGAELMALEYQDHWIRPGWPKRWSWRRPAARLMNNAGFFPLKKGPFDRWQQTMRLAIASTDFLCAWQTDSFLRVYEEGLIGDLAPGSRDISLGNLGLPLMPALLPFRWLVVSPFVVSIGRQLPRLREVHDPQGMIEGSWGQPAKTCQLVRCPFQSHLEPSPYPSWEEGLERLSQDVSKVDFDVALIGAGAWSLPLAARIKASGRSAIHLGGQTQLMFGIKGSRWESYGIYNDSWVTADPSEMPANRDRVEQGCYW